MSTSVPQSGLIQQPKRFDPTTAPSNYVAGLGRGATGFTTRSDVGAARSPFGAAPAGYIPGKGRGAGGLDGRHAPKEDDDDLGDYSESNFDQFSGFGGSLFSTGSYDQEDSEADAVWEEIDSHMESRRKARRETKAKEELKKFRLVKPKIADQFLDLKEQLNSVSDAEWEAIPEIGERKAKKRKVGFFSAVPDTVLVSQVARESDRHATLDTRQQTLGGFETPSGTATTTDLTHVGSARKTVLDLQLSSMADNVSGQTVVDPKGYLTDLKSIKINSEAEVGDIKKARLLLKSVTTTNPTHGPGWIAAARLEEVAGKLLQARKIITRGTQACSDNEDVWLEAARLHPPDQGKIILARAIQHLPKSVKIWLRAAKLESELKLKKRVLRRALEFIPNSVRLWKAAIELEEPENARIMLARAVECVPLSVEMWLALARLETYENARKVLNKARETIPTEPTIWITAAKLEEANGNEAAVRNIIKRSIKSLSSHGVMIDRDSWLKEAETAEQQGSSGVCQAIVLEVLSIGVEEEDRKRTWLEDAESALAHGSVQTARAIYGHALTVFPAKKSIWLRAAFLEKNHGSPESLDTLLKKAVKYCPQAEILWLMAAKERWLQGDIAGSQRILSEAFQANPDSEAIWLAAVKLEKENNEPERARALLKRARERAGTARVWMKSALLERELGDHARQRALLEEAQLKFPKFDKLWMMRGQLEEAAGDLVAAQKQYQLGLSHCPNSIPLWLCAAKLQEKLPSGSVKARAILEKARLRNPKNDVLWLNAARVELQAGNPQMADNLISKAFQECPNSGILWAQSIGMAPRQQQKARGVDALKRCDNDPHVITAVAKIFWRDRKLDKARTWFNRAVTINPDLGDAWATYYAFERQHGTPEQQEAVLQRCIKAEPKHGELWTSVSKHLVTPAKDAADTLKKVAAGISV